MTILLVTSWRTLMMYAKELGQAELSGDSGRIAEAKRRHDDYRDLCLQADQIDHSGHKRRETKMTSWLKRIANRFTRRTVNKSNCPSTHVPHEAIALMKRYSLDELSVEDSFEHETVINIKRLSHDYTRGFPYKIARWRVGQRRFSVLMKPRLRKERAYVAGLYMSVYREDSQAMLEELMSHIEESLEVQE